MKKIIVAIATAAIAELIAACGGSGIIASQRWQAEKSWSETTAKPIVDSMLADYAAKRWMALAADARRALANPSPYDAVDWTAMFTDVKLIVQDAQVGNTNGIMANMK